MNDFKVPQNIPQDLLLIHDIIGVTKNIPPIPQKSFNTADDCIDSSDSENGSEDEIEADLIAVQDEDEVTKITSPDPSDSSSDDTDSDSDDSDRNNDVPANLDLDDDEDSGPTPVTGTYFQTKHELNEEDISVPSIEEVGPEEDLEKVGHIMAAMDRAVVIKGLPSEILDQGSERALDSDTLLVFDDRKVLGYIYETFGPTSQPLYQVRFNKTQPPNPEQLQISREVFHVPHRSRFVFLSHIKRMKGSDASNVHDEEPADNELEFSDDEAEAAFKSSLKRKRGESRGHSAPPSRMSTPTPSQMHDQDLAVMSRNAYDEHGPYDLDFGAGPSRPPPIPYDDPYEDDYLSTTPQQPDPISANRDRRSHPSVHEAERNFTSVGRSRGHDRPEGRGRGRGRGRSRGRGDHGDNSRGNHDRRPNSRRDSFGANTAWSPIPMTAIPPKAGAPYNPHITRPLSPTSLAIARATGQMHPGPTYAPQQNSPLDSWGYQPHQAQQPQSYPFESQYYPSQFVQPHINPRFASAFGMNMAVEQYALYDQTIQSNGASVTSGESNWTDEWTVPTLGSSSHRAENDSQK